MQPFKTMILTLIAVLGIGFAVVPQANAEVVRNGVLSTSDNFCVHRSGAHEQVHTVRLVADQTYVIDLMSNQFDTYLFLEHANGNLITSNDDGGSGLNARIVFTPTYTGDYNIVTSSYLAGASGSYTLRVSP